MNVAPEPVSRVDHEHGVGWAYLPRDEDQMDNDDEGRLTAEEAVAALDALYVDEDSTPHQSRVVAKAEAHENADWILRRAVSAEVAAAYERVMTRTGDWMYA